jgi:hypothetical protein
MPKIRRGGDSTASALDEMQKGGRKVSRGCEEREKCGAGKRGGGRWRPVCFKGVTAAGSMERNGGGVRSGGHLSNGGVGGLVLHRAT